MVTSYGSRTFLEGAHVAKPRRKQQIHIDVHLLDTHQYVPPIWIKYLFCAFQRALRAYH